MYLGYGALGLGSLEPPVRTMVACYEWGAYLGDEGLKKGIKCMISGFTRANAQRGDEQGQDLRPVRDVGAREAHGDQVSGFEEALMLDPQGFVAEGTGENIFIVKHGVVRTPPTSAAILAGITRDTVIRSSASRASRSARKPIARDELYIADEVFLTGTAAEITPVRDIDHRKIGRGEAGPVTRRLQESFFSVVKGNDTKHDHWLTFVCSRPSDRQIGRSVDLIPARSLLITCVQPVRADATRATSCSASTESRRSSASAAWAASSRRQHLYLQQPVAIKILLPQMAESAVDGRALPARSPGDGPAAQRAHRARDGRRHDARRRAVHGDGVPGGPRPQPDPPPPRPADARRPSSI